MSNNYTKNLVAISSGNLQLSLMNIPDELVSEDLEVLEKLAKPTEKQRQLKIMVQRELERAEFSGDMIVKKNLCQGVMHVNNFDKLLANKELLAWLVVPEVKEEVKTKLLYQESLDKLKNIMDSIYTKWQLAVKVDEQLALAKEYHNLFKTIAARAAPIVQRQEIKTQAVPHPDELRKVDSVEERIKALEQELSKDRQGTLKIS